MKKEAWWGAAPCLFMRVYRPSPAAVERARRVLRWRRRWRLVGWAAVTVFAISIAVAHAARSRATDDWSAFNHRSFRVTSIVDGETMRLDGVGEVALLGVSAPHGEERGAAGAPAYLVSHAMGKTVTVLLEVPQTRDGRGRLLAYLFGADGQSLNVAMVRDGVVYAERRSSCSLSGAIQVAETGARKKKVGVWNGLTFDQMPLWRQWWLATLPRRGEE